jgi:hypothetical protein
MMLGMSLGFLVEIAVAALLALTIGYCVVLNRRLERLHADKDALRQTVADLMQATLLANSAIGELKIAAREAETSLAGRLDAARQVGEELKNHVNSGQHLVEKIAMITHAANPVQLAEPASSEPRRIEAALQALASRPRIGGQAA